MSPDGHIAVIMGELGDITVEVFGYEDATATTMKRVYVQFCTLPGGDRSLNTRTSLMDLADAIEKDNMEHPIH